MSSSESSGAAPAEATATNPAPDAAFPSFGSTRGSGLARGKAKRPSAAPAASASTPASDYKPTAIEVVHAPREYTNPFAPAEQPVAEVAPAAPVVQAPAPVAVAAPVVAPAPVARPERVERAEVAPAAVDETPAELNILPPAEQKSSTAQTWESEGFRPARERAERPRREERVEHSERVERSEAPADEPVDIDSIPPQFLYVRPGVNFVPTPRNWGGAPRERRERDESAPRSSESPRATPAPAAAAPAQSGGFLGWLKGLFGGSPAAEPTTAGTSAGGEVRRDGGEQRRHRGGRNRGGQGGGEGGGQRRNRGGRGRSGGGGGGGGGGYRGERSEGTRSSGSL